MSTPCNKFGSVGDAKSARATGSKYQGDLGEHVAGDVLINDLGFTAEFFDPAHNGLDGVFRDQDGRLCVVESKFTDKDGLKSLGETNFGPQGSPEKIAKEAELMQNPDSSRYSDSNARLGAEMEANPEDVRSFVVWTNPTTLESVTYERIDGSWEPVSYRDPMGGK